MSDGNGFWYSIGYFQGRGSTYDKPRRRRVKEKPSALKRVAKGIGWVLMWGFFILTIGA